MPDNLPESLIAVRERAQHFVDTRLNPLSEQLSQGKDLGDIRALIIEVRRLFL
jgi:hypothetical protein